VDDVLCGSLVLDAADYGLFPDQPNPVWLEIHDNDHGGHYDVLLMTRGGRRELLGLGDLLLEGGGAGIRLRLHRTPAPYVVRVEWRGVSSKAGWAVADGRDNPARRVWRALLEVPNGVPVEELAAVTDQPVDRVRVILGAYACFEPLGDAQATWRLDPSQPGLRPQLPAIEATADAEVVELARSLLEETRTLATSLRRLDTDIDLLEERLHHLEEGRR
jgi:hypothetical protein